MAEMDDNSSKNLPDMPPMNNVNAANEKASATDNQNDGAWQNWNTFNEDSASRGDNFPQYKTLDEYSTAVRQWIWHYQTWNSMNTFNTVYPLYVMNCLQAQNRQHISGVDTGGQRQGTPPVANGVRVETPQQQNARNLREAQQQQAAGGGFGEEYNIPPIWKRVLAEFIDFFLLFMFKLGVTIFTVEYIGIIEIDRMDIDMILTPDLDYNTALSMTSELIAMEVINRIFICIFETLCLRKGIGGMRGGSTPGKRIMGLKVVSCEEVMDLAENRVRVSPAQDIGFWSALVRSVIKNFSLAFFFPVCFTVFFFQQNRAAYDIISNSLVVECHEEELRPRRR